MINRSHNACFHTLALTSQPRSIFSRNYRTAAQMTLLLGLGLSSTGALAQPDDARQTKEASEDVLALPAISVHRADTAVTDAYAGGQIASGGRVGLLGDKGFMETPFNTIGYTEKFIADQQALDITGVIAATDPTVFSSGVPGQNLESFSIRGFRSAIGDVTLNGLPGVAPYYRSSPEIFERIDVLKGPSALLYGMPPNGSVGGAVNLVTKRADDEPLTRITTSYLSDSQLGGHVDIGRRFGDQKQFGVRFNGVIRDGESAIPEQDTATELAALGLDWRGERARVSADLYVNHERIDAPTRGLTLAPGLTLPAVPDSKTLLNPDWAFNDTNDKGAMVRGELDINDSLTAFAAVGARTTDFDSLSASVTEVTNAAGDYRTNLGDVSDEVDTTSAEIGLRGTFATGGVGHEMTLQATRFVKDYALFGRRAVLADDWITNIYNPIWGPADAVFGPPPIITQDTTLTSYALADTLSFAQDKVQLTLGMRHQTVEQDTFLSFNGSLMSSYDQSATTPAVALLVKATDNLSLYANYIEGLSQGDTAPASAVNAGEAFAPYKTQQTELGLKLDLGSFAHTVSLFEITRPSSFTDPITSVFSSGGEQRNRGVEWGFFGTPVDNIRLTGGLAYIEPEITRSSNSTEVGKQATGVPELQGKLGVEWDLPSVQGLTLTSNVSAASNQYINTDNTLSVPGRAIYDLGARYVTQAAGQPLTLRLSVKNLTDKEYWAMPHYTNLAIGAPRTVQLSATMDF